MFSFANNLEKNAIKGFTQIKIDDINIIATRKTNNPVMSTFSKLVEVECLRMKPCWCLEKMILFRAENPIIGLWLLQRVHVRAMGQ